MNVSESLAFCHVNFPELIFSVYDINITTVITYNDIMQKKYNIICKKYEHLGLYNVMLSKSFQIYLKYVFIQFY